MPEQRDGRCMGCEGPAHPLGHHCPMYRQCCGTHPESPHSDTCHVFPTCDEREFPEHPSYHDIEQLHECSTPPTATQKQADAAIDRAVRRMLTSSPPCTCPDPLRLADAMCPQHGHDAILRRAVHGSPRVQCMGCGDVEHPGQACPRGPRPGHRIDLMSPSVRLTATLEEMRRLWRSFTPDVRIDELVDTVNSFMAATLAAFDTVRNLIDVQAAQPVCGPEMHTNADPGRGWPQ